MNLYSGRSQISNKDRKLSSTSWISDDDEFEEFLRNLHHEVPNSHHKLWLCDDDEFEKFLGLSHDDELVKSPSSGSVRHSREFEIVRRSFQFSKVPNNFESQQSIQTGSPGECRSRSMRSDYCVSSQECKQKCGNLVESLLSIGSVTLEERSRQSSSNYPSQASQTSERKTHSHTSAIPKDSTHKRNLSQNSQSSNKDRTFSLRSWISDDDEYEEFMRNLHSDIPKGLHKLWLLDDDEFEKFLELSDHELVKSRPSGLRSMRSDYCVSCQESKQTYGNQAESMVSIGSVILEERSRQSFSTGPFQGSRTSENKTHSVTSAITMDSTQESIHDVKVKRRNILREKLLKWKIGENNHVVPLPKCVLSPYITKVIDGETLTQVAKTKDVIYYADKNGLLGKGGFGVVFKGYAIKGTEKTPVAVKFAQYSRVPEYYKDKDLGPVPGEVYFLKQMKYHPNVIKFLHYQQLTSEMFVIICERIANCKDLFDVRKERGGFFTEYETQKYVKTLVDVVRAMEKKNIIHRDIKLENILYDVEKDDIKLIDFGLATKHKPGKLFTTFWGSETNVPPEFITDRKYDISKEAVRSIGITIYEMLYGRAPYTDYKKFSDVISGLPQLDNISDAVKNLLTELLAMNPKNRPTIKKVAKHSWLRVKQSLSERLPSFIRSIFRKRRGSYDVNIAGTAKQSGNPSTPHASSTYPA